MAKVPVINLRKGHAVNYNNDVCVVVSMEHKCPPRMASYVQMSIRSISTKKVYNLRLTSNESLEGVNLAREGHFIHTYMHDGNPLPSFEGEPKWVKISGDIDEFTDKVWNSLNEDNKVSLFVRYIDIATGEYETKIVNKNK